MDKAITTTTPVKPVQSATRYRLLYVDNLRIILIALVVLHHLIITYGAPGSWFYNENEADGWYALPFTLFVATNQSFFMGMFFFISAYFTPSSYDRKGPGPFLKDRLLRLGIPLLVFFFLLCPLTVYFRARYVDGLDLSFPAFWIEHQGFGFGPLWFVETLVYFTFFYMGYRWLFPSPAPDRQRPLPGDSVILLFVLALGIGTFIVRLWLPVGWSLQPLGLQFPHFIQYIALLILGVAAYRHGWLEAITYRRGLRWLLFAQACIFLLFPAIFLLGGAAEGQVEPFMGGLHWQSFAYAVWEQVTGFALIIGLLGLCRGRFNRQGSLAKQLSAGAYTVFIIHAPVIVLLAVLLRPVELYPPVKFLLLAPVALALCFALAHVIRQAPGARRIL